MIVIWNCVLKDENITDSSNGLVKGSCVYVIVITVLDGLPGSLPPQRPKNPSMRIKMKSHNKLDDQ